MRADPFSPALVFLGIILTYPPGVTLTFQSVSADGAERGCSIARAFKDRIGSVTKVMYSNVRSRLVSAYMVAGWYW